MRYERIVRAIMTTPWAILPAKAEAICELIAIKAAGGDVSDDQVRLLLAAARPTASAGGAIAVLPIMGTIVHRAGMLAEYSGGTSTERVTQALRQAIADPSIGAVVLDVDSPGGSVNGVPELAAEIRSARERKPIVAVANALAASAGYWLASQASEVLVTPSGEVGSIGVIAVHEDVTAALERQGVKLSIIRAGAHKGEGNPYEPLTDEARAAIQADVDRYYAMFLDDVAAGRGVSVSDARDGFGEGRVVGAREAVRLGMADRVGTFDDAVQRAAQLQRRRPSGASAADDLDRRRRRARLAGVASGGGRV